ncbi:MAG: zinc dependent phospholipase C family protein [Anaerorhabdus sp.]
MPSVITHELFAQETLKLLSPNLKNTIMNFPMEYSIGSSGPDLFFYYNAWPWLNREKAKNISHVGSLIHDDNINKFFQAIFTEAKRHPTPDKISYLCGFICHWALDKSVHPYIFYKTGDISKNEGMNNHRRFESQLDTLMLKRIKNLKPKEYPCFSLLKYSNSSVQAIYDFYNKAVSTTYNIDICINDIEKSLSHFYSIRKFLFDPYNIKSHLFLKIEEKFLHNPYCFTSLITPNTQTKLDILNLSKKVWHHPCTNEVSNLSFIEMFNKATLDAADVLILFDYYLHDRCTLKQLLQLINNQSFETGKSIKIEMKYYNPIY